MADLEDDPDDLEEDPEQWRARRFMEHMVSCERAFRAGVIAAATDAVMWCKVYAEPPPEWLVEAVASLTDRQTPAEAKRHLDNLTHYARYDAVTEHQGRDDLKPPGAKRVSLEHSFDAVAQLLGTDRAAVKKSYLKVAHDFSEGRGGQYFIPTKR